MFKKITWFASFALLSNLSVAAPLHEQLSIAEHRNLSKVDAESVAKVAHQETGLRCALDIGSGSSRIKVAEVDPGLQKMNKIVYPSSKDDLSEQKIAYKQSLKDGQLPDSIIAEGAKAIRELVSSAEKKISEDSGKAVTLNCSGVATSAFREAKNGAEAVAALSKASGAQVVVISQKEEAILGFLGTLSASSLGDKENDINPSNLLVWDIGGGSMQFTLLNERNATPRILFYDGGLASEVLKSHVIKEIQGKREAKTPNPIDPEEQQRAIEHSREKASALTELKNLLSTRNMTVVGIGGVHGASIREQAMKPADVIYNPPMLQNAILERAGWDDAKFNSRFADTDGVNLLLVLGYMEALGIKQVIPTKVNLADGVLIDPYFWK